MHPTRSHATFAAIACAVLSVPFVARSSARPAVSPAPPPTRWISSIQGAPCDRQGNHAVLLRNSNTARDILVAVQWHVSGGRTTGNRFRTHARSTQEIGCAAGLRVVDAQFVAGE